MPHCLMSTVNDSGLQVSCSVPKVGQENLSHPDTVDVLTSEKFEMCL